jgi:hypothetical protein
MRWHADRTAKCIDGNNGRHYTDDLDIFDVKSTGGYNAIEPFPRKSPRIANNPVDLLHDPFRQES